MKMSFGIASFLLLAGIGHFSLAQISKDDMLKKLDHDQITLERAPLINVPSQIRDKLLKREHARYPNFKDSMWYVAYVKQDGYTNIIHYDWGVNKCFYFTYNDEALKKKTSDVVNFVNSSGEVNSKDASKVEIPVKYCEKIYNFYSGQGK